MKRKLTNTGSEIVFEELEPRLLLSADPLAVLAESSAVTLHELVVPDASATQASTQAGERAVAQQHNTTELVIIDSRAPNFLQLYNDALKAQQQGRDINVVVLSSHRDGIEQISEALSRFNKLDAVHIVSHGDDGQLQLGATLLTEQSLKQRSSEVAQWKQAFKQNGDILIYGCKLASTSAGAGLADSLAELTETEVAASDDLTGAALKGGDWDLEYKTGAIESNLAFSEDLQQNWQGVLDGAAPAETAPTETVEDKEKEQQAKQAQAEQEAVLQEEARAANKQEEEQPQAALVEQQRQEIVFIDDSVANYQAFVDDLLSNSDPTTAFEIVVLDSTRDGIEQISQALTGKQDIDALHIISHGSDGAVKLGNTWLNTNNIGEYSDRLNTLSASLDVDADILIYGCNLAESVTGKQFVSTLAEITGTDVAVSDDLTGNARLGGDWDLEYKVGTLETRSAVSVALQQDYQNLLGTISGVAYMSDGVTTIGAGTTISMLINGSLVESVVTGAGGDYNFTTATIAGDVVALFVDNSASYKGITVTVSDGTDLTGVEVIANHITIRNDNGGATSNADLAVALGAYSDPDIHYTISGSTLIANGVNDVVFVPVGHSYVPGGNVSATGIKALGTIDGGANTFTIAENWYSSLGSFVQGSSTVNMIGTGTLNSNGGAFYNLITGASGQTTTLTGNVQVRNVLTIAHASGTLTDSGAGYDIRLTGNGTPFVNNGAAVTARNFIYYNANPITVTVAGGTYNVTGSLQFDGNNMGAGVTYALSGDIIVNGSGVIEVFPTASGVAILDTTVLSYNITANELQVARSAFQAGILRVNNSVIDINGDVSFNSSINTTINLGGSNWTVAGNWNNRSTGFSAGTSTVVFDGGIQSLTGSTAFNNLTKVETINDGIDGALIFDNTATQTIKGTLTLTGLDADDRINLMSDVPGSQWSLNLTASAVQAMDYIRVTDSDASASDPSQLNIDATNSYSGGNNLGWFAAQAGNDSYSVDEGSTTNLDISSNDTDPADGIDPTSIVIVNGPTNGSLIVNANGTVDYTHDSSETLSDSFSYTIKDNLGNVSNIAVVSISVNPVNDAPVANSGGPYSIKEGQSLTLDASASSDVDGDVLTYSWDINNDGTYGDVTGVSPTLTWAQLQSFGIVDDGTYTIGLEVNDGTVTRTTSSSLTVTNAAPVISTTGLGTADEGQIFTLNLSAIDPGSDTVSSWKINWGDGNIETFVGNPASVTHVYNAGGSYAILASVIDEDGTHMQNELLVASFSTDSILRYEANSGVFLQSFGSLAEGLDAPYNMRFGPDGNIYVSGYLSNNILRYDSSGVFIDIFVPAGSGGITAPYDIAFGPDGNMYVASGGNKILRYDGTTGAFKDVFAVTSTNGLTGPIGLAFDDAGRLYVSGFTSNNVLRYDITSKAFIDVFVTSGAGGGSSIEAMSFGPDGNLYIANFNIGNILRFDGATGAFIDIFADTAANGLAQPNGLSFGPDGYLYISGYNTHQVSRYDASTGAYVDDYVTAGYGGLARAGAPIFEAGHRVTVNAAPDITTNPVALIYTENDGLVAVDSGLSLRDFDNITLSSAVISISANYISGEDLLSFINTANITGSWNAVTGVLTLTGPDTVSAYQAALRSISYSNASEDPDSNPRTVSFVVNDGAIDSQAATRSITVVNVNDAPVAVDDSYTTNEDGGGFQPPSGVLFNDYDIEGSSLTAILVTPPANGSFTLNANGSYWWWPDPDFNGVSTFTYKVNDGISDSNIATVTLNVTAVNDAPVLNDGSLAAINEDTFNSTGEAITTIFAGQFSDVDAGSSFAGIAVVGNAASATTEGVWQYSSNGGSNWFDIGFVNDTTSALAINASSSLRFVPVPNFNGTPTALVVRGLDNTYAAGFSTTAGSQSRVSVTTSSNGGTTAIAGATASVMTNITAVNDAPYANDDIKYFNDTGAAVGSSNTQSIVLGDIDGDGDLDMVEGNAGGEANRVYINDGNGNFTDSGQLLGADDTRVVVLGDIDGDGDLDIVTANATGQANRVYINDGNGIFTDSGQLLGSSATWGMTMGDVDGDGDLDIVMGNNGDPDQIFINDGSGNFTDSGQLLGFDNTLSVTLGDIDGDGDLDLVTASFGSGNKVYINDGSGNFTDSGQSLGPGWTRSVALGDIDGDGDLDLIMGDSGIGGQPDKVYLNDGTGMFTDSGQKLGSSDTRTVVLSDINADGHLDLIVGNFNNTANHVYINDGSGNFIDSTAALGANRTSSIAVGDIDGDGDLDIVAGNANGQANHVYTYDNKYIVDEGNSINLNLAANDFDIENNLDLASIVIITAPANGSLVVNADGTVDYTHDGSETTADTFSYTISDINGAISNIASVSIVINPVNDAPVANIDTVTVDEGANIIIDLAGNDTDADDGLDLSSIAIISGPVNGMLVVNNDGTVLYTHDGSETINDSFSYTISDLTGAVSNITVVNITVTAVNDAPTTSGIADVAVDEDAAPSMIDLNSAFADVDNPDSELSYSLIGNTNIGLFSNASIDAVSGRLTLDYAENANGVSTLSIRAQDTSGAFVDTVFTVTVTAVNDLPVIERSAGMVLNNAAEQVISTSRLNSTDVDNTAAEIVYTITAIPQFGTLLLNGVELGINDTFTQDDIVGGRLTYKLFENTTQDKFEFTVKDNSGTSSAVQAFNMLVQVGATEEPVIEPAGAPPEEVPEPRPVVTPEAIEVETETALMGLDALVVLGANQQPVISLQQAQSAETDAGREVLGSTERDMALDDFDDEDKVKIEIKDAKATTLREVQLQSLTKLWHAIDKMKQDISGDDKALFDPIQIRHIATTTSGIALTAGVVAWALRSGALLASFMTTLPLWRGYDPMPILAEKNNAKPKPKKENTDLPKNREEFLKARAMKHESELVAKIESLFSDAK